MAEKGLNVDVLSKEEHLEKVSEERAACGFGRNTARAEELLPRLI